MMFKKLEDQAKKDLIKLYVDYIKNPSSDLEERALRCEQDYGGRPILSEVVAEASFNAIKIAFKELSIHKAENILKKLKGSYPRPLLELSAISELLSFYNEFCDKGMSVELSKKAKQLYDELTPDQTLLSDVVNSAVGKLFAIAYPDADPERKIPSNDEVKKIVFELKKLKEGLENMND